jgi:2-polyprenyl-3-methyl-5-hydroxy-6-metoxy-1,4-benzoquinol methylase
MSAAAGRNVGPRAVAGRCRTSEAPRTRGSRANPAREDLVRTNEENGMEAQPITQDLATESTASAPAPSPAGRPRQAGARTLDACCVVRARDFRQPWFAERAAELGEPLVVHRKLWEFCVIAQVCREHMAPGARALGFGVGLEPLAAWFARQGASVLATDRPDETMEWDDTHQHARGMEQLRHPGVCPDTEFEARVRFLPLDMNAIPDELCRGAFDFTWSAGSFEHIGGIDQGLEFFRRQMACLRPGGLAVHTTEYNPIAYAPTLEEHNLSLFRVQELAILAERLAVQGDRLWPLDLASGLEDADQHIDRAPYGLPHLKLALGSFVTTSVLLVARRGDA